MCGLSGYVGITDPVTRALLTHGLSEGIDGRGGDAAGYVSISPDGHTVARTLGKWCKSDASFARGAMLEPSCMMHARYATMGAKDDLNNAHPYTIVRDDVVRLIGCHNGVLQGTAESAAKHNRPHTVDSLELYQLLADGDHEAIRSLTGYGTLTWVIPGDSAVHVCLLSKGAPWSAVLLADGGVVWGSTDSIVTNGMNCAKVNGEKYTDLEQGRVYRVTDDGIYSTDVVGITVGEKPTPVYESYQSDMYSWVGKGGSKPEGWDDPTKTKWVKGRGDEPGKWVSPDTYRAMKEAQKEAEKAEREAKSEAKKSTAITLVTDPDAEGMGNEDGYTDARYGTPSWSPEALGTIGTKERYASYMEGYRRGFSRGVSDAAKARNVLSRRKSSEPRVRVSERCYVDPERITEVSGYTAEQWDAMTEDERDAVLGWFSGANW